MTGRAMEDEVPISPKPHSPAPEIFSSKKIFFLNSSYSESRRSEIPHIESGYYPRDEVSRRLFQHGGDSCDCDCSSDGCWGCLRRNKQYFFKFFVVALSVAFVLLLYGSLSYSLAQNKVANESYEFEKTEWVSHYHEYPAQEERKSSKAKEDVSAEPVSDLPVPVYEHSRDYDSSEDVRKLHYRNPDLRSEHVQPISFPPLEVHASDSRGGLLIIYDGREPPRIKRFVSSRGGRKGIRLPFVNIERRGREKFGTVKRDSGADREPPPLEGPNEVEGGMEKFWEIYFKKGKTVFEPFSLTTPRYSTPLQADENSKEEEDSAEELENKFLNEAAYSGTAAEEKETASESSSDVDRTEVQRTLVDPRANSNREILPSTIKSETAATETVKSEECENVEKVAPESDSTSGGHARVELATNADGFFSEENEGLVESAAKDAASAEASSIGRETDSAGESLDAKGSRTWSLFPFRVPLSGLFGSSHRDQITAEPAPSDTVRGISLADAKKIKKERRKHMLSNSRVVGGSSDVRLPTAPDVPKPFLNAFETLKTNQQLSFTPSAASQFILPYQMCLFAGSFPGFRPSAAHAAQPRTFSLGTPFVPALFDKDSPAKNPVGPPAQQNILSFSINNYPNVFPPRQPALPSAASSLNFPAPQQFPQFPGPGRQPAFCTYLQPPLFQFPTVPGTADFSHAKCVDCRDYSRKQAPFLEDFVSPSGRGDFCSDGKVSCADGSGCVPAENWCDNRVHCKDASDEALCSCRERVARDRLCDGYVDCPHGEDEVGCFDCPKSAFSCDSVVSPESCIPLSKRCDGVRDCATGADEEDCSALFFHVRRNDSYHVSQVQGYLHRNWKGDWFPVCREVGESLWAEEACLGELGASPSGTRVSFAPVSPLYKGPFVVREEDGTAALQDHCKGHASTYVECPAVSCGTRIEHRESRETESAGLRDEVGKSRDVARATRGRRNPASESEERKAGGAGARDGRPKREETGRVVGGRESEPRAWPWAIAVYKNGAFHCGGVILDKNWVLTAAHCMEQYWKNYYEVRGGMLRRFSFSATEQARTVSHVIIHENYDLTIMSNDLALLRLQEPFHFNRWVRPACLPALRDGISKFVSGPAPGTRCTAVGWGALRERGTDPDQLREVEIPIMVRCKHKEDLVGEEICAGKAEGGKDTCQGDSGGPLLCRDSGIPASWYVAGIVSHGEGCARPGEPGAYTRISLFVDWITANANDFHLPSVGPLKSCPGFRCRSASRLCIPRKWVCNGYTDCLEAEDEKNCTSDSAASNIFNHPYSGEYKYLEDAEVDKLMKKPESGGSVVAYFDSGTPPRMENEKETRAQLQVQAREIAPPNERTNEEGAQQLLPGTETRSSAHEERPSATTPAAEREKEVFSPKTSERSSASSEIIGSEEERTSAPTTKRTRIEKLGRAEDALEDDGKTVEGKASEGTEEGYEKVDVAGEREDEYGGDESEKSEKDGEEQKDADENPEEGRTSLLTSNNLGETGGATDTFNWITEENPNENEEGRANPVAGAPTPNPEKRFGATESEDGGPRRNSGSTEMTPTPTPPTSEEPPTPADPDSGDSRYFQCRSIVQSILASYRCDGVEDCEDGTDEENCFCARALLFSSPERICDGRKDCPDGSDEKNCRECLEGEFRCKNSERCISSRDRCDGKIHCEFGEDETRCLALAEGGEPRLRENGEPFLETEGVLMVNRNGAWSPKCQEEASAFGAAEAVEVCSSLGTIGYESYENRSLAFDCTGFRVTCAEGLASSMDGYRTGEGTHLWPWNAFVYSDGEPVCTAALLRPRWLLTSSHCLRGISFKKNYVAAKLGALGFSSKAKEPDSKTIRVDGAHVLPDSDVALLHLSEQVDQTETIRLLGIPYSFDSDPEKDSCVAVGDRTLFLKISERCPEASRCFRKTGSAPPNCGSRPWIGVVVCQSGFGWYPSSVFSEESGHCGFDRSNFTDLRHELGALHLALDREVDAFPEPPCAGFRCSRGLCVPRSRACDGTPDCPSEEDESFELCKSDKEMKDCNITDLRCRNGRCIPKVLFGDGKDDCGDESDEPWNKTCAEYLRLTAPKRICDGKRNCHDKTDEDYKLCPCGGDRFRCDSSGYCIPKDFVCDGETDCPGGEDEERCMGREVRKNHSRTQLEILQRSFGVWHSVCSGPTSKELSDALCRDLGFEEAAVAFERNETAFVPEVDAFSWVKLNRRTSIALRGDRPFVKLVAFNKTCSFVKCA